MGKKACGLQTTLNFERSDMMVPGMMMPQQGMMMQPQQGMMMQPQQGMMMMMPQQGMMMPQQGMVMPQQGMMMMPQQGMMMSQPGMMMQPQGGVMMPQQGMMMPQPGGLMQQQQLEFSMSTGSSCRPDRSRSPRALSLSDIPARPPFADDASRLSSALRSLGLAWQVGKDRCCSKKFRDSLVCSCNCVEWPMVRLSTIIDEYSDMLLFASTGIGPCTKPSNFAADSKGAVRDAVRLQYAHKIKVAPLRLRDLGDDMDNLPIVAMKLGYNVEWLSPQMKVMWEQVRLRHSSAMTNLTDSSISSTPRRAGRRLALAIGDAVTPLAARGEVDPDEAEPAVLPEAPAAAWSVPRLRLPRLPDRRPAAPVAPAGDDDDDDGDVVPAAAAGNGGNAGGDAEVARLALVNIAPGGPPEGR